MGLGSSIWVINPIRFSRGVMEIGKLEQEVERQRQKIFRGDQPHPPGAAIGGLILMGIGTSRFSPNLRHAR